MNLHALPKIELHLHLDCCLSYDVVRRLAPDVTPEAFAHDFVAPPKCRSLAEYLRTPPNHVALMQSEEALRLVVDNLFAQLGHDGVIYAEIRFAPLFHTRRGLSSEQVVAIVDDAVARASTASGIEARIILATLRHFSKAQSLETVRLVERFRGTTWSRSTSRATRRATRSTRTWPRSASPSSSASRYGPCRRSGRPGERVGDASAAPAPRIGHGVRSIEDERLLAHLAETGIHLEVCPSCNVQTDVVATYRVHPVNRLYQYRPGSDSSDDANMVNGQSSIVRNRGISLGISTDTRTVTDVTLTQEYQRLNETFGWGQGISGRQSECDPRVYRKSVGDFFKIVRKSAARLG